MSSGDMFPDGFVQYMIENGASAEMVTETTLSPEEHPNHTETRVIFTMPKVEIPVAQHRRSNGLTNKENELVTMLAEEAAEIAQACGKILRHGLDSYHPKDPSRTNRHLLQEEILDFTAVKRACENAGMDFNPPRASGRSHSETVNARWQKKLRYTHHQQD